MLTNNDYSFLNGLWFITGFCSIVILGAISLLCVGLAKLTSKVKKFNDYYSEDACLAEDGETSTPRDTRPLRPSAPPIQQLPDPQHLPSAPCLPSPHGCPQLPHHYQPPPPYSPPRPDNPPSYTALAYQNSSSSNRR